MVEPGEWPCIGIESKETNGESMSHDTIDGGGFGSGVN
jgi:hypothetical protein